MQTRDEIMRFAFHGQQDQQDRPTLHETQRGAILEVLLDIRDLLTQEAERKRTLTLSPVRAWLSVLDELLKRENAEGEGQQ